MPNNPKDYYGSFGSADYTLSDNKPLPTQSIDATPAAFGAQVGQAEQSAGQATEKGGMGLDELAGHFQDIYNDSTSRDAVTEGSKQLAQAEFNYKQQKGLNAANAFPVFQKSASDIMENLAASMPNPAAQKNFKDDFSKEIQQAIFRSGSYAADQVEQGQTASLEASMSNKVGMMAAHITDPTSRAADISSVRDEALQYAHIKGLDPETADKLVSHNIGEGYATGIRSIIQTDPDHAKQLYDEALNGSFTVTRKDDSGNPTQVQVPYIDAAHRAQITSEMQGEFRRQESEQLMASRAYAAQGADFNPGGLAQSMKNAGRSDDYIHAELGRLNQIQDNFGSTDARYQVDKSLKNDEALALAGQPPQGIYDPATLARAYPKEPDRVNDILNEARNLHTVAGFTGSFTTKTPLQIYQELGAYQPNSSAGVNANNLGNVKTAAGAAGNSAQFENPASPEDGVILTANNLRSDYRGMTLSQIANKYAPPSENKTSDWLNNVSKISGISADSTPDLDDPSTLKKLLTGIAGAEKSPADRALFTSDILDSGIQKSLNGGKPTLGGAIQTGQDFTQQSQLYATLKKSADIYTKQLYADPAGVILAKDPLLTSSLNAATKDLTQMGPYVDAMMSREQAVGVPESKRTALPKSIATSIVNNILSNPETAPQQMNQLSDQIGDHWPAVYHSLVTQGGLPPYYQSIQQLGSDPSTQRDAALMARWMGDSMKGKTDSDLLGPQVVADTKKNILADTHVQQLMQSIYRSGGSKTQVDGIIQSIQSLSFAKHYYDNDGHSDQNAINAFTNKYSFMTQGGARVPNEVYDAVNDGARQILNNVDKMAVVPPAYSSGAHGAPTPKEYFDWLKNSPTWVTSPMENGIYLKDPMDRLVRDKLGNPLVVPFSSPKTPPPVTKIPDIGATGDAL